MNVDNKSATCIIGAAGGYYRLISAEDCIGIEAARIQFLVLGNGIVNTGQAQIILKCLQYRQPSYL